MNIFVLSKNLRRCAKYHCNKHVVKMILEYAQLLSTCYRLLTNNLSPELDKLLYKKTHVNHPCCIWVRQSSENYKWLYGLFVELCHEYTFRYNRVHKTEERLLEVLRNVPENIPITHKMTRMAQAMPEEYKQYGKPVEAYRTYYINDKNHFCEWYRLEGSKKRIELEIPYWFY